MTTSISGYIERVTYYNEENGFVVAKLQEMGKKGLTTIVGNLPTINPGESLRLTGKWVYNKKFGEQFQVEQSEMTVPATLLGIRKYLGSGLVRGVGPVLADRIVQSFGLETLDIIEKKPGRLSEVEGIGEKRIEMIRGAWEEQKEIKEIMIFLHGHGVSPAYSAKIYKYYGKRSIDIVRENPYQLAHDIHGIGFITADKIARNLGIDPTSVVRAKAGLLYLLSRLTEDGHVYVPESRLTAQAAEVLKVDLETIASALVELSREKEITCEKKDSEEGQAVYLASLYVAEKGISDHLKSLQASLSTIRPIQAEKAIEWVQEKLGIALAPKQREAVALAAASKILVVTGGPGTGKTTIINAVLKILEQRKRRILLAAPTGRAAKRMSEATGWEAKTIHRLLEYSPKKGRFQKGPDDPLDAEVVIIDEASMVDTLLMYHLLRAIPSHAHLILVGDVDQLPSVGPGNVLQDIIDSRAFTVVRLTEIFRQAQESMIVVNAHRINRGEFPLLTPAAEDRPVLAGRTDTGVWGDLSRSLSGDVAPQGRSGRFHGLRPSGSAGEKSQEIPDFLFIEEEDPEKILNRILSLCLEEIPKQFSFHPVHDIQVMTPMHRGIIGVTNLNIVFQKTLHPGLQGILLGSRIFKPGDKVMQVTNNYDKDVFNGDIGWISEIRQESQEARVDFDGRIVVYDRSDLDEIVLAYAISVHKSQGSEYPAAIVPITTQHYLLLQRNLLYTAITRAKKLVVLIGTRKALGIAVRNNKPQQRYTGLAARLCA